MNRMKKILSIVFVVAVLFSFHLWPTIEAQELTPTPPDIIEIGDDKKPTNRSTVTDTTQSDWWKKEIEVEVPDFDPDGILIGTHIEKQTVYQFPIFKLPNDILVPTSDQLKTPKLDDIASRWSRAEQPLMPMSLLSERIPDILNKRYAVAGRRCVWDEKTKKWNDAPNTPSSLKIQSTPMPELSKLNTQTRQFVSQFGLLPKDDQDYTLPPTTVNTPFPCHELDTSKVTTIKNAQPKNKDHYDCGIFGFVCNALDFFGLKSLALLAIFYPSGDITIPSNWTNTTHDPYSDKRFAYAVDAKQTNVQTNDPKDKNAGGFISSYIPGAINPANSVPKNAKEKPNEYNAGILNKFDGLGGKAETAVINFANEAGFIRAAKQHQCILTPQSIQNKQGLTTDDCIPYMPTSTPTSCELPTFSDDGGECGICNADSILGPLARKILTAAGKAYGVSAANIWTAMWHEGATWPKFAGQFTDENVKKWSISKECGGKGIEGCNDSNPLTEPPFGWIDVWFYNKDNSPWTAVQKVDPTRNTIDKVSKCNFLDAAFATAKALYRNSASITPGSGPSCGTYTFDNTLPNSCSSWSDLKIAQSHTVYLGQCPDGIEPYTIADLVSLYKSYKCN